jgi:hypothetical protein
MHDLYQGSRLLNKLLDLASISMRRMRKTLLPAALSLPDELLENQDISKVEMHAVVSRLEKYAEALAFAGHPEADTELATHFIDVLKAHPRPNVVAAVNAAESAGDSEQANTVARLRMTFLKHIPLDAIDHTDVQAHVSHVSPSGTTMLERTCAALLAILPNSKRQASAALNGAAPKVCRTLAEQDVYIKEIWNQHRINYQDPEWLQDKLAKARKVSYSRGSQRRGRGNYQGTRGGGRGDTSKQNGASGSSDKFAPGAKGTATADRAEAAVDPEAFCAHMNLDISHDLESERLLHPQTVPLTTWTNQPIMRTPTTSLWHLVSQRSLQCLRIQRDLLR